MVLHFVDLHIHSRFSRATSNSITINNIEKWARVKGLSLVGTGDFTHPKWVAELKENLKQDDGDGIYKTKTGFGFLLSSEISLMYSQTGKSRKVHFVLTAPNFEVVDDLNAHLLKWGRLDYDGRPIFGRTCLELVDLCESISKDIEIIPAHAWTPYFGIFGSMSGFDSIKDCFAEKSKKIHAIETGLSSDPAMNWRISALDDITLLSFSDAHSYWPWRIGRECTAFELEQLTYKAVINAIRKKDTGVIKSTIEFFPEEGKYHYDGHRNCNIFLSPKESTKYNNVCPVCRKPLTLGVLHRVEELADRPEGFVPKNSIPYYSLMPLSELIQAVFKQSSPASKRVWEAYDSLINSFGSEIKILLEVPREKLAAIIDKKVVDAILQNRAGSIKFSPGFDGVYGEPLLGATAEETKTMRKAAGQKTLGDY